MDLFQNKPAAFATSPAEGVGSKFKRIGVMLAGFVVLAVAAYFLVRWLQGGGGPSTAQPSADQAPTPVDGTQKKVISAGEIPLGEGSDYGVQFWMYIKDWNYQFGQEKVIMERVASADSKVFSPRISLHPTDNSLNVSVSIFPSSTSVGSSVPAASNDTSAAGDSFTCTVENVPLQSWFAVSVTVFQRNLDIYLNGRLVKSCVLPGIPKPAVGDMVIAPRKGFSGSLCTLKHTPGMIGPSDAMAFFNAGTPCSSYKPKGGEKTAEPEGSGFTLFGYKFFFSVKDTKGSSVADYSF